MSKNKQQNFSILNKYKVNQYMKIIFATLWILRRALPNYQYIHVRDLYYGHPPKHPTNFNIRDLSHGRYFSKLLIFFYIRDISHEMIFWSLRMAHEQLIEWQKEKPQN
jgi:hypothetical protein